ncbi:MAG: lipooligosaccharide transport system permease protein [Alphaproteobacteria bacterium]|jgi:lipooligosaccharide transport system permease protein
MTLFAKTVFALWSRHYLVWRTMFWPSLSSNVFNPLLFLFSFGFGMGSLIETMEVGGKEIVYMSYIIPGMMAYSGMFTASFETSISSFARSHLQGYWNQVLATPATLHHLLWMEIIWATSKALFAVVCVMLVSYLFTGIEAGLSVLLVLPVMFVGCLCFSACGMVATSLAKSFDMFSYFFTFWVTPMFIFSGVFFPVTRFPEAIQWLSFILPMTHIVDIVRIISADLPYDVLNISYKLTYIVILTLVAYSFAYHKMKKRIFD